MSTSKNLSIPLLAEGEDMEVLEWVKLVNGEGDESMAQIIDAAYGNKEVYSESEPSGQKKGDTWYKVLPAEKEG